MAYWSGAVIAIVSVVAGGTIEHLRTAAAISRERRVTEAGLRRARMVEAAVKEFQVVAAKIAAGTFVS
jgi:hypothetical protein